MRALVACFGNLLRGDDGFGPAVAQRLEAGALRDVPGVEVMEVGIGGIHLVQALMDPVDLLVIVDAVDVGRPAGTVVVQIPAVPDVAMFTLEERRDALADIHYATPERALMLAKGLGVLPERTFVVGCQVEDAERVDVGLSATASGAVGAAVAEIRRLVTGDA